MHVPADGGKFSLHLAGGPIQADHALPLHPDQRADDEDVGRRVVSRPGGPPPQLRTVPCRVGDDLLEVGAVDDLVGGDQRRRLPSHLMADEFHADRRTPQLVPRAEVQADQVRLGLIEQPPALRRKRRMDEQFNLLAPEALAARRVGRHDRPAAGRRYAAPPNLGVLLRGGLRPGIDKHDEPVADAKDLPGMRRALAGGHRPARRRVENTHRGVDAERDVDQVVLGRKTKRRLRRTRPEPAKLIHPGGNPPLPQHHAVEGVARHQKPLRRKADVRTRRLVDNVEEAATRRHARTNACQLFVSPGELGPAQPLHATRNADDRIVRDRVVVRTVEIMRPLVDLLRPPLDGLRPGLPLLDIGHAARRKHAHHLGLLRRDGAEGLDHNEVDEVLDVGKPLARPPLNRHRAVQAERPNVPARRLDVRRVGVEAVDQVIVAGAQRRRQAPLAAPHVNEEPALDAGLLQNLLREGFVGGCAEGSARARTQNADGHSGDDEPCHDASFLVQHESLPILSADSSGFAVRFGQPEYTRFRLAPPRASRRGNRRAKWRNGAVGLQPWHGTLLEDDRRLAAAADGRLTAHAARRFGRQVHLFARPTERDAHAFAVGQRLKRR